MKFIKALSCLVFACVIAPAVDAQSSGDLGAVTVTWNRTSNTGLIDTMQQQAFTNYMSPNFVPELMASRDNNDGGASCSMAREDFIQSGCSIGGSESNPLNYNPNAYDSGTGLNKALGWAKDSLVYQPAASKFFADLLRYEDHLNQMGGNPADWAPYLLNDLADDCVMQGANGAYNAPFFDCVGAVNAMASEVTAAIDQATKQGIIDKMAGAIGKKTDGSGSVGVGVTVGPFSPSWSVNYQSTTSSLEKHRIMLAREHDCADLRSTVVAACGDSA